MDRGTVLYPIVCVLFEVMLPGFTAFTAATFNGLALPADVVKDIGPPVEMLNTITIALIPFPLRQLPVPEREWY
jgi:hypothetical protein